MEGIEFEDQLAKDVAIVTTEMDKMHPNRFVSVNIRSSQVIDSKPIT